MELETANSTMSVDVSLTDVYFSPTGYKTKYPRNRKRGQGKQTVY